MPSQPLKWSFNLAKATPTVDVAGGTIQEANAETFPALAGNGLSVYLLELAPGAIRIPHWHPNASEVDYVLAGTATVMVASTSGEWNTVTLGPGEITVIPMGWFHYIANTGEVPMRMLVIFGNEQPSDIGLSVGCQGIPPEVLGLTFATNPTNFANLDTTIGYIAPQQARSK